MKSILSCFELMTNGSLKVQVKTERFPYSTAGPGGPTVSLKLQVKTERFPYSQQGQKTESKT